MPMNISQQIITLNIRKTPDSDIFSMGGKGGGSVFELEITVFDDVYASFSLLQYSQHRNCVKKTLLGYHLPVHNYVSNFEYNLQILIFFMFF